QRSRECPVADDLGEVEQRPGNRGDRNAALTCHIPHEGRASERNDAAVPAWPAAAGPSDGLELPRHRPDAPRRGRAGVAQDTSVRCERGAHPSPPVVVLEDRRDGEPPLLDLPETSCPQPVLDCGIGYPQAQQLAPRDAVELAAGQLGYLNVPHTL